VRWRGVALSRLKLARRALLGTGHARHPGAGPGSRAAGPGLVLAAALAAIAYGGMSALFRSMDAAGATPRELSQLLGLLFGIALAALLVFDLEHAVSALLLDRDLELLRRAPVQPWELLVLKLADALPRTLGPLVVLVLPALAAWAALRPLPPAAWLVAPALLACLWAIPIGLGVVFALALLRRLPPSRAREGLSVLSTLAMATLWIANLLLVPRLAASPGDPFEALRAWLAAAPTVLAISPGAWAAEALEGARTGDWATAARAGGLLGALAAAAGALALWSTGGALDQLLDAVRTPAWRGARPGAVPRGGVEPGPRGGFLRSVLTRDRRLFARDWTVLSDVLTTALLWTLLPLAGAAFHPLPPTALVRVMLMMLAVGLGHEVAARAFPIERRGQVWMRLAPIPAGRWVAARLSSALALALPLVAVAGLALGLSAGLSAADWVRVALAVLPALLLSLSIGLWVGASFGDPGWTHPRAMLSLTGRLTSAGFMVLQVGLWLLVFTLAGEATANGSQDPLLWAPAAIGLPLALLPIRALTDHLRQREYSL